MISPEEANVATVAAPVVVADWIKRIADEERTRDAVRIRGEEMAAREADLVRVDGRRLLDELRVAVIRDIRAFESEFEGDISRHVSMDAIDTGDGFTIRKSAAPAVSMTLVPNLGASTLGCQYKFTLPNGLPPREDRLELVFHLTDGDRVQVKHLKTAQTFTTADGLSEFLLVPIFTGRAR